MAKIKKKKKQHQQYGDDMELVGPPYIAGIMSNDTGNLETF